MTSRGGRELHSVRDDDEVARHASWLQAADHNRKLIYLVWFLFRLMDTVSYGPFFDTYLSEIDGGKVAFVGYVESVNSITMVLASLPLGILADRHRRTTVMRLNACLGALSCLCYCPAILSGSKPLIFLAVLVYALYSRGYGGTMDVMIADIVTPANATKIATQKTSMGTLGLAIGPLLQLIILLRTGDAAWSIGQQRLLILGGWCVFAITGPAQCLFKDLPMQSEAASASSISMPLQADKSEPLQLEGIVDGDGAAEYYANESYTSASSQPEPSLSMASSAPPRWWVEPCCMEAFRVTSLLCGGMTTRYFALMFKNLFDLSPALVAVLFAASPLLQVAGLQLTPLTVSLLGRYPAAMILHISSCAALLLICFASHPTLAAVGFLLYQATMKMVDIPIYAVLLETVPHEHRGKFFHLFSIRPLTFGASAFLGGHVVDVFGYRVAIAATCISTLLFATPWLLVPKVVMRR